MSKDMSKKKITKNNKTNITNLNKTKLGNNKLNQKSGQLDVGASILINNKPINVFLIDHLIIEIKQKKEFSSLDEPLVFSEIIKSIKKSSKITSLFSQSDISKIKRSKEFKLIVKEVRKTLHRLYGMYQKNDDLFRTKILSDISNEISKNVSSKKIDKNKLLNYHNLLLKSHSSSDERLPFYTSVYNKIFSITGKPSSISDFGCGLNPISIPYMPVDNIKLKYLAYDISKNDIDFLNSYFKIVKKYFNVSGNAQILNLIDEENSDIFTDFKKSQKTDVCFLFKVLEIIELNSSHSLSEKIIVNVPSKFVVASFPTATITNKIMNHTRRGWMHLMLERLGYTYKTIEEKNEIFFVIDKRKKIKIN